jgi:hypothetical protein
LNRIRRARFQPFAQILVGAQNAQEQFFGSNLQRAEYFGLVAGKKDRLPRAFGESVKPKGRLELIISQSACLRARLMN